MAPFTIAAHDAAGRHGGRLRRPRAPARAGRSSSPRWAPTSGGDIVAGMLATGLTRDRRIRLFIDVGTNSEIALGSDGARARHRGARRARRSRPRRSAAACAPPTARSRASRSRDGDVELQVIGDVEPVGLCGSGLVDAVAELVARRPARPLGPLRARRDADAPDARSAKIGEERVFVMPGAATTVVSSPSATCASCSSPRRRSRPAGRSCCASSASSPSEIAQVLLAGSFGSYLSPASAVRIGLVPRLALPRIVSAGNVAGEGAKIVALSVTRARRGARDRRRGRVRRALRPRRLQRPVRRPARVPGMTHRRRRLRSARAPRRARSRVAAAGTSTSVPLPAAAAQPARADRAGGRRGAGRRARERYDRVVVAYADCGTYGALDDGCASTARAAAGRALLRRASRATRCARRWPRSRARTS